MRLNPIKMSKHKISDCIVISEKELEECLINSIGIYCSDGIKKCSEMTFKKIIQHSTPLQPIVDAAFEAGAGDSWSEYPQDFLKTEIEIP